MNMGGWEWAILILIALLVFGGSRLAGLGKNAGRAIREFKEETSALKPGKAQEPAQSADENAEAGTKSAAEDS